MERIKRQRAIGQDVYEFSGSDEDSSQVPKWQRDVSSQPSIENDTMKDNRKKNPNDFSLIEQISPDSKDLNSTLKRTEVDLTPVSSIVGSRLIFDVLSSFNYCSEVL